MLFIRYETAPKCKRQYIGKPFRAERKPMSTFSAFTAQTLRAALMHLLCSTENLPGSCQPRVFDVTQELIKHTESFRMCIGCELKNFTPIAAGQTIAEDKEKTYRVGAVPEFIIFPNRDVRCGMRAGLMVVPVEGLPSA